MNRLRCIVTILTLIVSVLPSMAHEKSDTIYTFRFCHVRDMFYVPTFDNDRELNAMLACVDSLQDEIHAGRIVMYVDGYCNSEKTVGKCLAVAKIRSNRVKSELIVRKGVKEEHFITRNHANRGDLVTVRMVINRTESQETIASDTCSRAADIRGAGEKAADPAVKCDKLINEADPENPQTQKHEDICSGSMKSDAPESMPVQDNRSSGFKLPFPLALRTNGLYDLMLVPNIGLSAMVTDRLMLGADWMGTWLNDSKHHYYRIYGGHFDLSWRIGDGGEFEGFFSGHHVGVYASMIYYDIQRGVKHRGFLSDKYNYSAGISYTFSYPLSRHFDLAFSIGLGYMWGKYMRHRPIDDHDVWISTHRQSWFGPTRAGVSLVWMLGNGSNGAKKGGTGR